MDTQSNSILNQL